MAALSALRIDWPTRWIKEARLAAERSLCSRDRVGAVIVSPRQRQIASGYNGPPRGFDHGEAPCVQWCARAVKGLEGMPLDPGYTDCPSLHAEANAFAQCGAVDPEGATLYVTSHVCFTCAKSVAQYGIAKVVVVPEHDAVHRVPEQSYHFLRTVCGVDVEVR